MYKTDLKKTNPDQSIQQPEKEDDSLYNSQGEETVFIVTCSGGNLNEVHGMHILVVLVGWWIYEGRNSDQSIQQPEKEDDSLYNSQGVETVFIVTCSGGNLNEVHGMHILVVLVGWWIYGGRNSNQSIQQPEKEDDSLYNSQGKKQYL